eukprot:m.67706 g.67706  ORF g.67706 m.67706 type:complete len:96 (-) comp8224_c1_seq3:845-1132(-)
MHATYRNFSAVMHSLTQHNTTHPNLPPFLSLTYTAIYHNEKLTGSSHYIVGIWGFLLVKWGVITLLFCDILDERDGDNVYDELITARTGTISDFD